MPTPKNARKPRQGRAFLALTWASLLGQVRNFSALFFGFLFPIIFISIFGLLGNAGNANINLGVTTDSDQSSPVYQALSGISSIKITHGSTEDLTTKLKRGDVDAMVTIVSAQRPAPQPPTGQLGAPATITGYDVTLTTSNASPTTGATASAIISGISDKVNLGYAGVTPGHEAILLTSSNVEGTKFSYIDFALPGQLGFSLLSIAIFGTAFGFIVLKRTLVFKRIFATPTRPTTIILAQGASRLIIAAAQVAVLLGVGVVVFHFHLANGALTFFEMMFVGLFGLVTFLGLGLLIAGNFRDENAVGPIINLITLPQFLLAGTFFPITALPHWLQPIANVLPLAFMNEALRNIASRGDNLWDVRQQLLGLLIWGVVTYILAIRTFKWE